MNDSRTRCGWCGTAPFYVKYHDEEWGVPVYDDQKLFEFLVLESAQAGLSWATILQRREGYRKAFSNFNPWKVARFDGRKVDALLQDTGIIRNRLKIKAAINNAKVFLKIQEEFGSFAHYQWGFVDGRPVQNSFDSLAAVPSESKESRSFSKDLKQRGMSFVGPIIIYAHMQSMGMVNDHLVSCFRYSQVMGTTGQ